MLEMRFAIFNRWQEINSPSEGRFLERISPSAYRKSLKESFGNIWAILSHGKDPSLGSSVLGNIASIREEADRAVARVNLFRSVPGLLLDGFRAGVYGASFRGEPIKSKTEYRPGRSRHNPEGMPEITRLEIRLRDIGPTPFAAYEGTMVASAAGESLPARSLPMNTSTQNGALLAARPACLPGNSKGGNNMPALTPSRRLTIRDFVEPDVRVVALEGFQLVMGQMIERGAYRRLSDPIVRQFPEMFAIVIPVEQFLGEIEIER